MNKNVFVGIPQAGEDIKMNTHQLRDRHLQGLGKWGSSASAVALFVGLSSASTADASATAPRGVTVSSIENPLSVGEQTQGRLLAFAAQAEGVAYEQTIQALMRGYADTLPGRVAASRYSADSWRQDVVAAFALARITQPVALDVLERLPGLQPEYYLEARRPEPTALRDLRGLRAQGRLHDVSVAEVLWKTRGAVKLSSAADFPAAEQTHFDDWSAAEYGALLDGLIMLLGESEERAAHFVLRDVLQDDSFAVRHRALAASALGQTGSEIAEAPLLLAGSDGPDRLRHGALMGLGRLGSENAIAHLRSHLSAENKSGDFRVVVSALGRAGARGAGSRSQSDANRVNPAEIALALVDALALAHDARDVQATIEALCVVGDASALPALAKAAAGSEDVARYEQAERRLRRTLSRLR